MSERPGMNALKTGKIMFMELDRKHNLRSQFCCFFVVCCCCCLFATARTESRETLRQNPPS